MNVKSKVSYVTDLKYLSGMITEYDIQKANISILYNKGMIDKTLYDKLWNSSRNYRNPFIGNLIKSNRDYGVVLANGLIEFKDKFYEANNITESDIISIHNDAIFIYNKIPSITQFDNVNFIRKDTYTIFIKLFNIEIYYYFNIITNNEYIEVKGINNKKLLLHNEHFLEFIKVFSYSLQVETIDSTIDLVKTFYNQYLNKSLSIGYYREFNEKSSFRLNNKYLVSSCDESYKDIIDISYNNNMIRELYGIIGSLYFSKYK